MTALETKLQKAKSELGRRNFEKGMTFEFKLLRRLKPASTVAMRSAGSHGIVDLYCLRKDGSQWFVTVKHNGYWTAEELSDLRGLKDKLPPKSSIKMAYYISPKKYVLRTFVG